MGLYRLFLGFFLCSFLFQGLAGEVSRIGTLENPKILECSGIIASRRYTNTFWVHNDGGARPLLFAVSREGRSIAEFVVGGMHLHDWEDIAIDETNNLFIADTGNNNRARPQVAVYQIPEPDPATPGKVLVPARRWNLRYPANPFDAEAFFVWKTNGYLISKVTDDKKAEIYRFPLGEGADAYTLEFVTKINVESPVTGADLSPDGALLGVVAKSGAFIFRVNGDIANAGKKRIQLKFKHESIEGCCFVPEGLLAAAESKEIFLYPKESFDE